MMYSRIGIFKLILCKILKGDFFVLFGYYVKVLVVLGLLDDLIKVVCDDELGRKI